MLASCGGGDSGGDSTPDTETTPDTNEGGSESSNGNTSGAYSVDESLRGDWVYVHSGEEFYLGSTTDLVITSESDGLISVQSDDTYSYHAIRSGNSNSQLSGSLQLLDNQSTASSTTTGFRSIGSSKASASDTGFGSIGGIDVILVNLKDSEEQYTVTTEEDGSFEAELPTGEYQIQADTVDQAIDATIEIEGTETDIGILTLAEDDIYNFKTVLDLEPVYGNYETYTGTITVYNYGNVRGVGLSFTFDCEDEATADPLIESCVINNKIGTIEAGSSVTFDIEISFKYLDEGMEQVRINNTIRDVYNNEWPDYFDIPVYKRSLTINLSEGYGTGINGYLISPGHEITDINSGTLEVPYIPGEQYQIALANGSISSETTYSLGFDTSTEDLTDFNNGSANEPDDSEAEATLLSPGESTSAFLAVGDIDYYTLNMPDSDDYLGAIAPEFYAMTAIQDNEYYDGERRYLPGESFKFDLAFRNRGHQDIEGVTATISTEDEYVQAGNVNSDSFTIYRSDITDSDGYTIDNASYGYTRSTADFYLQIPLSAPEGHQATINILLTDTHGNEWTDQFTITVGAVDSQLVYYDMSSLVDQDIDFTYSNSLELSGNNDGIFNPGETISFQIGIENTGSEDSYEGNVRVQIDDPYISVNYASGSFAAVPAGSTYDARPVVLSASTDTPIGYTATLSLTFTTTFGVWYDTMQITVEAVAAELDFYETSELYDEDSELDGGVNGVLNAGESASFDVAISNTGTSNAMDVLLSLSTDDAYLEVTNRASDADRTIGQIEPKYIRDSDGISITNTDYLEYSASGDFVVSASEDTPDNHTGQILLTMSDRSGVVWTSYFPLTVKALGSPAPVLYARSAFLENGAVPSEGTYGDGDGILEAGELGMMNFAIFNEGNAPLEIDYINITMPTNSGFTYTYNNLRPGVIPANEARDMYGAAPDESNFLSTSTGSYVRFQTSRYTDPAHSTTPTLTIAATDGTLYEMPFYTITLGEEMASDSELVYADRTAFYDNNLAAATGDNDGILDAGETVLANIAIANSGSTGFKAISIEATTESSYVSVELESAFYCWLGAGETRDLNCQSSTQADYLEQSANEGMVLSVAEDAPSGHTATINLVISDQDGNEHNTSFDVTVGQP